MRPRKPVREAQGLGTGHGQAVMVAHVAGSCFNAMYCILSWMLSCEGVVLLILRCYFVFQLRLITNQFFEAML